jgi:hypothetical protein
MRRRFLGTLTLVLVAAALLGLAGPAAASEYDRDEAGNPVRMVGTLAYPLGFAYEYLWLKPVHWLGHKTPFRQVVGQDTFDEAYEQ